MLENRSERTACGIRAHISWAEYWKDAKPCSALVKSYVGESSKSVKAIETLLLNLIRVCGMYFKDLYVNPSFRVSESCTYLNLINRF
jgi:hypothetical protein